MSTASDVGQVALKVGMDAGKEALSGDYVGAAAEVVGDVAQATLGRVPVVGSVLSGAAQGAVEGVAVTEAATTAVEVGTVVVAVAASAAGDATLAGTAIGVGAAIGNVIPIPGLGAAIGAAIGALVALGELLSSELSDTFHPTPLEAEAWLTIFRLNLCFAFSGVDNAITPEQAARLVRYFKMVSHEVLPGQKGNTGDLYNPVSNDSCDNPYMCRTDPDDPLTDAGYMHEALVRCRAAQQNAGRWFDHGRWINTITGRLAANLAGRSFTVGDTTWLVDADGFAMATSAASAASAPAPPALASEHLTITDANGRTYVARPLLGRHNILPGVGDVATLSQNSAVFPNAPWADSPGTDMNHSPGTLHTGDQLKVLSLPSTTYQGARWAFVRLLSGSTDNISAGYQGWVPAALLYAPGVTTGGVAAGWKGRPTVLVDMPRVGLLLADVDARVAPAGVPASTGVYPEGTNVQEVAPNSVTGWSHVEATDGSGATFWVPWSKVAWDEPEQHLWQMQLENEGQPTAITTPAQAQIVLTVLRSTLVKSNIDSWSEFDKASLAGDVRMVRRLAGESGPDPVLDPVLGDTSPASSTARSAGGSAAGGPGLKRAAGPLSIGDWVFVAGIGAMAVGISAAVIAWKTRDAGINLLDVAPPVRRLEEPGAADFHDVIVNGLHDGKLKYRRGGMRSVASLYFHKAFNDARVLGISPTELAVSGRYFGEEVLPIRIEVHPDGSRHLVDGRHRYMAAKDSGASSILAEVVLRDLTGGVVAERLVPVQLL